MADIFISYRRSDEPGYVGRLADSLEQMFGEETVYRDVDSEHAGGNWKKSITRSVSGAQVVLAVIGPQWQEILVAKDREEGDWTRFELTQAHSLDIPVIPVTIRNVVFDHGMDLGDLAWLSDIQFFELSDGQGRWQADLDRLASEISRLTSLQVLETAGASGAGSQQSGGDQSPNIQSGGGNVSISFGSESNNT